MKGDIKSQNDTMKEKNKFLISLKKSINEVKLMQQGKLPKPEIHELFDDN